MKLIETYSLEEKGYKKLYSFQSWRVAMLNFADDLIAENIAYVEAHNKTDEAFILLKGNCMMVLGRIEDNQIVGFDFEYLKPNNVYNIPKGVYHSHVLSHDAKLVIVEEEDTSDENSNRIYLNEKLKEEIVEGWRLNEL